MTKRLFALLLALLLLAEPMLTLVPEAEAAPSESLKSTIASQFDAYAAKLKQSNSANDCVDAMLYPAIFGSGSAQSFGESSAVTAAIYNSALFREYMVTGLPAAVEYMQSQYRRKAMMGGNINWYNSASTYNFHDYIYNETIDTADDINYVALIPNIQYTGSVNRNDQALMLVVGGSNCRLLIKQVWASSSQIRYRIDVTVSDTFDFSGNSSSSAGGFNTVYTKMLNAMGKFLRLKTYKWTSKSSFEITVPNTCPHTGGNYRWENIGQELVAVSGEGLMVNNTIKVPYTPASDGTPRHYYELENTVALLHSLPWTLELCIEGGSGFSLSPTANYCSTGSPSILKLWNGIYGIENVPYYKFAPEGRYTYHKRHQHGILYLDYGVRVTPELTLVLENRVAENGSNQVWLSANGQEVGPMIHYAIQDSQTNEVVNQADQPGWFNGKDFFINFLFNKNVQARSTMPVHYLEIRNDATCVTTKTTEGTCTAAAVETSTCILCGGSWTREIAPALGHTEETIPGTAATCTESGLTEGKKCTVCGETTVKQEAIPALGHIEETVPGKAPTCLEEGLSEGKHCTLCGQTTVNQELLPAAGHTPEAVPGKAPTCLEEGLSDGSRCSVCGEPLILQEAVPATGHTEGPMAEKAPTCAESGLTGGTACTVCGTVLVPQEPVPALPHTEQPLPGKAPTCTDPGLTEGTACAVCGQTITAQEAIPATGHSWDAGTVTTEPTATDSGVMTYICTVCGAERTEEIPAMGETILWGDVNGDGFVDSFDASLIMKYDVLLIGDDALNISADVSGDGFVDSYDASLILKFDVLLIDKFPAEA